MATDIRMEEKRIRAIGNEFEGFRCKAIEESEIGVGGEKRIKGSGGVSGGCGGYRDGGGTIG